jgi:hypothetical protein
MSLPRPRHGRCATITLTREQQRILIVLVDSIFGMWGMHIGDYEERLILAQAIGMPQRSVREWAREWSKWRQQGAQEEERSRRYSEEQKAERLARKEAKRMRLLGETVTAIVGHPLAQGRRPTPAAGKSS